MKHYSPSFEPQSLATNNIIKTFSQLAAFGQEAKDDDALCKPDFLILEDSDLEERCGHGYAYVDDSRELENRAYTMAIALGYNIPETFNHRLYLAVEITDEVIEVISAYLQNDFEGVYEIFSSIVKKKRAVTGAENRMLRTCIDFVCRLRVSLKKMGTFTEISMSECTKKGLEKLSGKEYNLIKHFRQSALMTL